jgi:ribosomal protein S18 acetylase RimI-like enzyme
MEPILRPFREEDVPATTQMWRESLSEWSGAGDEADRKNETVVRQMTSESDHLSLNLIQLGDRIVGFCDVKQAESEPEFSYVALLNVSPDCHGKGYGRMLLQRAVQDSIDAGQRMIDLGTWPSNMKAVPLYKKTGFSWVPDTNVHMENYIPQIVHMPLTRDFFARNDWYATRVCGLEQSYDRVKWHSKEVFPYRWEVDGEAIEAVIDRGAFGVTAFENDDFAIKGFTGVKQVPAGIPHTMTWEIVNKRDTPLSVSLFARSEDTALKIDKQDQVVVDDRAVITAPFTIDTDFEPKNTRVKNFIIRTDMVVDGMPLMLRTSAEQWQPVSLGMEFDRSIEKGARVDGVIRIGNEMERTWEGSVHVVPDPRVKIEISDGAFKVEPKSKTGVPVSLTLLEEDLVDIKMFAEVAHEGSTVITKTETGFVIKNCPPGELRTHQNPVCMTLVSSTVTVQMNLKGGDIDIEHTSGKTPIWLEPVSIGPPFSSWWMDESLREGRIERIHNSLTGVVTTKDDRYPGLVMEQQVTLCADGRVYSVNRFRNSGSSKHEFVEKSGGRFMRKPNRRAFAPLTEGIVDSHLAAWESFPSMGDLTTAPSNFAEQWMATQVDGMVCGLAWQAADDVEANNWGVTLQRNITVEPGEIVDSPPVHLIVVGGDWKTVRNLWQRTYGGGVPREEITPETRTPVEMYTATSPVITTGSDAKTDVVVQSSSLMPRTHKLALKVPDGWSVTPDQADAAFKRDEPSSSPVTVSIPGDKPTAGLVEVVRTGQTRDYRADLPVIRIGDGSDVRVSESDGIVTIDNGLMTTKASAEFCGSVHSVEIDGVEQVRSEYPEIGNLGWMRPWYGGIHVYTGGYPGVLHESAFSSELVEHTGTRGLVWKGVKMVNTPDHKELRGRRIEVEYLTTGGSNVIAVIMRAVNLYTVPLNVSLGVVADVLPDVGEGLRVFADEGGTRVDMHPKKASLGSDGKLFVGAYDVNDGRTVMVTTSRLIPDVKVGSMEGDAVLLETKGRRVLYHEGDVFEGLSWIAFADNSECASAYAGLQNLTELP